MHAKKNPKSNQQCMNLNLCKKCTLQQIKWDVEAHEATREVRLIYQSARISFHERVSNADDFNVCFTVCSLVERLGLRNMWPYDDGISRSQEHKMSHLKCDIIDNEHVSIVHSHWLPHILINIQHCWLVRTHCFRQRREQEMALAALYRGECLIKITFLYNENWKGAFLIWIY